MKGVVFALLQQVVSEEYGENTWDDLLDAAGVEGAYTSVSTYPDEEMTRLVDAASATLKIPPDQVLTWFGRRCMPLFASGYPHFFEGHSSARSIALALNDVIHPEVRKLFPGAYVPEFGFETTGDNQLTISYQSTRRLCAFAEGLLHGAADHFGEKVDVVHTKCMKHGDEACVMTCSFAPAA
jgi:hypothetical protein